MWPWLFAITAALSGPAALAGTMAPETVGPAPTSEAAFLLSEGRGAFGLGRYADAERNFSRFVQRHPAQPGYLDAQLLLGLARLRLSKHAEAVEPLRYYVTARPQDAESYRARIPLGRAYLLSGKPHEALLSANEVMDAPAEARVPQDVRLEALLLRAWSLIRLGKDGRARASIDSFAAAAKNEQGVDPLRGEWHRLELELKIRSCAAFGKGRLTESQARRQLQRRGTCLAEALVHLYGALKEGDSYWAGDSGAALRAAYRDYRIACSTPPDPPGRTLTIEEARRYKSELVGVLQVDCYEERRKALKTLEAWRSKVPPGSGGQLEAVSREIRGGQELNGKGRKTTPG